jgi:tRNA G18 (ribose-2'-O)-methylase SpoU
MKGASMDHLRICIGCNDGVRLESTHMGDTGQFLVLDVSPEREAVFVETRINRASDLEHARKDKMREVLGILHDVDVFIARKNSPNFRKIAAGTKHQPIVVTAETVEDALRLIQRSFGEIQHLVDRRRRGERPVEIPVFRPDGPSS